MLWRRQSSLSKRPWQWRRRLSEAERSCMTREAQKRFNSGIDAEPDFRRSYPYEDPEKEIARLAKLGVKLQKHGTPKQILAEYAGRFRHRETNAPSSDHTTKANMTTSSRDDAKSSEQLAKALQETHKRLEGSRFVKVLTAVINFIVLLIWTVLSFLLWIPLLTRMIVVFTTAIISSMFTGRDPTDAKRHLEFATLFYSRGFALIRDSMHGQLEKSGPFVIPRAKHMHRVAWELVFSVTFWAGIFLVWYGIITGTIRPLSRLL